jgi:para-aminobenzoate synthetase component 1
MQACHLIACKWRAPIDVLGPNAEEPYALALLSDASARGRWSYVARGPSAVFHGLDDLRALTGDWAGDGDLDDDHPPFRGGAAGLACYEWGAALEPAAPQARTARWPDLVGGIYDSLLAFDHLRRRVWAIGRGASEAAARGRAEAALALLKGEARPTRPVAADIAPRSRRHPYPDAVAAVIGAIAEGEIFQANIARTWCGSLHAGAAPYDVLAALVARSPAPFAGYFRLPDLAVVSNSPERFLRAAPGGQVESRPIKGTRPRGQDAAEDAALGAELLASAKDRAENLMIVDLMRNDLARVCRPGSVRVESLCALESFANVHHLVSSVTGELAAGRTALDLFASAFPPGSITGAPKLQAMKVIARHERPRGPYCGSLFWLGADGGFDSSVLIRTLAFEADEHAGWRFEARAGAGITADSDPHAEDAEAEAKISAIRAVLEGR